MLCIRVSALASASAKQLQGLCRYMTLRGLVRLDITTRNRLGRQRESIDIPLTDVDGRVTCGAPRIRSLDINRTSSHRRPWSRDSPSDRQRVYDTFSRRTRTHERDTASDSAVYSGVDGALCVSAEWAHDPYLVELAAVDKQPVVTFKATDSSSSSSRLSRKTMPRRRHPSRCGPRENPTYRGNDGSEGTAGDA